MDHYNNKYSSALLCKTTLSWWTVRQSFYQHQLPGKKATNDVSWKEIISLSLSLSLSLTSDILLTLPGQALRRFITIFNLLKHFTAPGLWWYRSHYLVSLAALLWVISWTMENKGVPLMCSCLAEPHWVMSFSNPTNGILAEDNSARANAIISVILIRWLSKALTLVPWG